MHFINALAIIMFLAGITYKLLQHKKIMKKIIKTTSAPAPIGPYNQAVIANGFLFVSGQIAINPKDGTIVQSTIIEETKQVMQNIKAVLLAADYDFQHIVKTTIFLSDMALFAEVNEVYGSYFAGDLPAGQAGFPARETVQVSRLPLDVNVEISVIAIK